MNNGGVAVTHHSKYIRNAELQSKATINDVLPFEAATRAFISLKDHSAPPKFFAMTVFEDTPLGIASVQETRISKNTPEFRASAEIVSGNACVSSTTNPNHISKFQACRATLLYSGFR